MYERQAAGMQTDRAYHLHSFGKLEVLNPEWLGDFSAIISMDTDTFVLRAPDEVFCLGPKVNCVQHHACVMNMELCFWFKSLSSAKKTCARHHLE